MQEINLNTRAYLIFKIYIVVVTLFVVGLIAFTSFVSLDFFIIASPLILLGYVGQVGIFYYLLVYLTKRLIEKPDCVVLIYGKKEYIVSFEDIQEVGVANKFTKFATAGSKTTSQAKNWWFFYITLKNGENLGVNIVMYSELLVLLKQIFDKHNIPVKKNNKLVE